MAKQRKKCPACGKTLLIDPNKQVDRFRWNRHVDTHRSTGARRRKTYR